jgi:hypothetical protein
MRNKGYKENPAIISINSSIVSGFQENPALTKLLEERK